MTAQVNIKNAANKGFTLIELMVVIAIIAILAVVGFSIFANAQKSARDSRRLSDIDSLAKSLETARNVTSVPPSYDYSVAAFNADYPNNKPYDPTELPFTYCIGTSATVVVQPTAAAWVAACPPNAAGVTWGGVTSAGGLTTPLVAVKNWMICAKLEVSGTLFCKSSFLR